MSLAGCTLKVIKECYPFEIGEKIYCIEDCFDRRIIRVWTNRPIFGVNEVILAHGKRNCFKVVF